MKNKIIKMTLAQITMWVIVCVLDCIYCLVKGNEYRIIKGNEILVFFGVMILLMLFLMKYAVTWLNNHGFDKETGVFKWITQYIIWLGIWILETVVFGGVTECLLYAGQWIIPQLWDAGRSMYRYMFLLGTVVMTVAIVMHILSAIVKLIDKNNILHQIINYLFATGIVTGLYLWRTGYNGDWKLIAAIIIADMCFFYNYCHYKPGRASRDI